MARDYPAFSLLSYSYSRVEHAALDGLYRRGGFDAPPLEPYSTQQNRYIYVYDRDNVFHYLWDTKANEPRSIPQIRAKEQA